MSGFRSIHFAIDPERIATEQPRLQSMQRSLSPQDSGILQGGLPGLDRMTSVNSETASRLFLQTYLEDAGSEQLLEITSPENPQLIPEMRVMATSNTPGLSATTVSFQQTAQQIPIFGGRVTVDVDGDTKTLVAINGKVIPSPMLDPLAGISLKEARLRLWRWAGASDAVRARVDGSGSAPTLTWYFDEEAEKWHLVYHFKSVPLAPRYEMTADAGDPFPDLPDTCLNCSPRSVSDIYDYFVDAHSGDVVFYFASTPRLEVPVQMQGLDLFGQNQVFYGQQSNVGFCLRDPLRNIETYDYRNQDFSTIPPAALPPTSISCASTDLQNTFPAAVSAHVHAQKVYDFYNNVLKRDGIDDKGMKLVSVVNVYSSAQNNLAPPQWANAVWFGNKMWYGQVNGVSFAKHLDVIAHELTHGVTQTSSNLIYRRVSGALNESFSDIFGVIIANWYPGQPQSVLTWNWAIGPGLGRNGGPIRDMSNPAATGQPDHWSQYRLLPLTRDQGGVHIYSGIHNKAVYKFLTDVDGMGVPTVPTVEACLLLYLTLARLTPTSDFADSRRTLGSVIQSYSVGNPAQIASWLGAVGRGFASVGL